MKSRSLKASYTVEATGVMTIIFFVVMILVNRALLVHAETVGNFRLHQTVERERHAIENIEDGEITQQMNGRSWGLEITAEVFRPEKNLRMWSLAEDLP